jgi:hypothetical protein
MHGYGIACLLDGSRYAGDWEQDKFHGWGRMEYADGSVYEGEFARGQRHGVVRTPAAPPVVVVVSFVAEIGCFFFIRC